MKPFVITVDFRLHPGKGAEFLPLITANARASLANEPGCIRFDVLIPHQGSDWVRLYEIYDSAAAIEDHRKAPHYVSFKEQTKDMIAQTTVEHFDLAEA
jgi:autoinducer 2-degrading protein